MEITRLVPGFLFRLRSSFFEFNLLNCLIKQILFLCGQNFCGNWAKDLWTSPSTALYIKPHNFWVTALPWTATNFINDWCCQIKLYLIRWERFNSGKPRFIHNDQYRLPIERTWMVLCINFHGHWFPYWNYRWIKQVSTFDMMSVSTNTLWSRESQFISMSSGGFALINLFTSSILP